MTPPIVGLDLSLTSTGIALECGTQTFDAAPRRGMDRIMWLQESVVDHIVMEFAGRDGLVAIEDYAFSRGGHAHEIGELGGVVKFSLIDNKLRYVLVGPSALKKYATGKGNADKTAMALAAFKRGSIEFATSDECDAWWLRAMALDALGAPLFDLPADQRKVLSGIVWPALEPSGLDEAAAL